MRRAVTVAVALVVGLASTARAQGERAALATDPERCGECHADEDAEHRRSGHHRAFTSPLFQREMQERGVRWCVRCHAPRAVDAHDEGPRARVGVDCAACHLQRDVVLATQVSGRAPHASRVDPRLSDERACASCHQLDVPGRPRVPLQDTVSEWRAAGETARCQDCHMPDQGGRVRHDLPGGRARELLSRAITVDARAIRDGWATRVDLTLRAREAAHAVPTGDVMRRLVVRAWDPARPLEGRLRTLGRRIDAIDGQPAGDDRVPPPGRGAREVTLRLDSRPPIVRWIVELWSLPPVRAGRLGLPLSSLRRTLAEGRVGVRDGGRDRGPRPGPR